MGIEDDGDHSQQTRADVLHANRGKVLINKSIALLIVCFFFKPNFSMELLIMICFKDFLLLLENSELLSKFGTDSSSFLTELSAQRDLKILIWVYKPNNPLW